MNIEAKDSRVSDATERIAIDITLQFSSDAVRHAEEREEVGVRAGVRDRRGLGVCGGLESGGGRRAILLILESDSAHFDPA